MTKARAHIYCQGTNQLNEPCRLLALANGYCRHHTARPGGDTRPLSIRLAWTGEPPLLGCGCRAGMIRCWKAQQLHKDYEYASLHQRETAALAFADHFRFAWAQWRRERA